jgi:hypothetical protein
MSTKLLLLAVLILRAGCGGAVVLLLVVVLVVKVVIVLKVILKVLLIAEGLAGEVVDSTRDDLLLEVLAELVVHLEAAVELLELLLVDVLLLELLARWGLGGLEEVEERVGGDDFTDDAGAARRLVALLLDLDLLGEVLVLLPLDVVANRLVVDKVAAVADLVLQKSALVLRYKPTW